MINKKVATVSTIYQAATIESPTIEHLYKHLQEDRSWELVYVRGCGTLGEHSSRHTYQAFVWFTFHRPSHRNTLTSQNASKNASKTKQKYLSTATSLRVLYGTRKIKLPVPSDLTAYLVQQQSMYCGIMEDDWSWFTLCQSHFENQGRTVYYKLLHNCIYVRN